MLTDQGMALIAEVIAAALLCLAIVSFRIYRATLFLTCTAVALILLLGAVTLLIEFSA